MIYFAPIELMLLVLRVFATAVSKDGEVNFAKRKAALGCSTPIVQVVVHATAPPRRASVTQVGLGVDAKSQHVRVLQCAVVMDDVTRF